MCMVRSLPPVPPPNRDVPMFEVKPCTPIKFRAPRNNKSAMLPPSEGPVWRGKSVKRRIPGERHAEVTDEDGRHISVDFPKPMTMEQALTEIRKARKRFKQAQRLTREAGEIGQKHEELPEARA